MEEVHVAGNDDRTIIHITCFNYKCKGHYSDHGPNGNHGNARSGGDGANIQQLQISDGAEEEDVVEEIQEFIDAEEVDDDDYDSDEGSVIVNFQHVQIKHQKLQARWEKKNEEYEARKQQEERCIISRRLSMATTRASRSDKYPDTDILIDTILL